MLRCQSLCHLSIALVLVVAFGASVAQEALAGAETHCGTQRDGNYACDEGRQPKRPRPAQNAAGIDLTIAPTPANNPNSAMRDHSTCMPSDTAQRHDTATTIELSLANLTVQRIAATKTAKGCAWHGVVQETGESALVMWWKDGRVTGVLGYKGRIYTITKTGSEVQAVIERGPQGLRSDPTSSSAENSADARRRDAPSESTGKRQAAQKASAPVVPFSDEARRALEAKKVRIDLMVLYTKRAASRYLIDMAELVAQQVEQANQSFRNSGLENISLRLVHTEMIDYDETRGGHFEHLYRMVDGVGPFKSVHNLRDEKRADIVGLIVEDPSGCGQTTRIAPNSEEAYFVVHHSCAAIMMSIAHEVGHILGARHDTQTDGINSPFAYGHGYVNGSKWRDIMSYQESCSGCRRIPYWSNPRVLYDGEPTGTDANDNARVILEQAERVSKFR
jgi:hypothetical protein